MSALDYRLVNFLVAALGGAVAIYVAVAVPPPHVPGSPTPFLVAASPSPIVVYVTGAIHKPGLYRLTPDARLYAAVAAAGGLTADAASTPLNLARRLKDEEMVVIPAKGSGDASMGRTSGTQYRVPEVGRRPPCPAPSVDVNSASAEDLETAGLSQSQAERLVAWRDQHGPIHDASDLRRIPGLKRSWRKIASHVGLK